MSDVIKAPAHYAGDGEVDCARAMESMMGVNTMNYWWGCAFKYLWRWKRKNGLEDLYKCRECLDRLIAKVEEVMEDGEAD